LITRNKKNVKTRFYEHNFKTKRVTKNVCKMALWSVFVWKFLLKYPEFHMSEMDYGHFAYETLHLLDSSPTSWTVRLLHTSTTVTTRIHIQLFIRLPYQ